MTDARIDSIVASSCNSDRDDSWECELDNDVVVVEEVEVK
tara:strand:- start:415 stop:534 length:120 start_codon:yes stop_codon:yes gene_type:complete